MSYASSYSFLLINIMLDSLSLQPTVLLLLCFSIKNDNESIFCFSRALECDLISQWCDTKKIWGRTNQPFEKRKKKYLRLWKVSLWFNSKHTLGPYRGLKIVKGRPPFWLAMAQIFLYVCVSLKMHVLLQSDRGRWVVEMRAVLPT